jgi:hypothetical protein
MRSEPKSLNGQIHFSTLTRRLRIAASTHQGVSGFDNPCFAVAAVWLPMNFGEYGASQTETCPSRRDPPPSYSVSFRDAVLSGLRRLRALFAASPACRLLIAVPPTLPQAPIQTLAPKPRRCAVVYVSVATEPRPPSAVAMATMGFKHEVRLVGYCSSALPEGSCIRPRHQKQESGGPGNETEKTEARHAV